MNSLLGKIFHGEKSDIFHDIHADLNIRRNGSLWLEDRMTQGVLRAATHDSLYDAKEWNGAITNAVFRLEKDRNRESGFRCPNLSYRPIRNRV